jgi:hypothetical protein
MGFCLRRLEHETVSGPSVEPQKARASRLAKFGAQDFFGGVDPIGVLFDIDIVILEIATCAEGSS